ncbi:MAG: phosphoribosylamine--glycine ligase [Desulfarculus sp.]|nr:phosphoribosylamine--glycine ligase [Desulfarculus sp.]
MKVLVIGSGGREHALVWKLAQSPLVEELYAAPGNPGMAGEAVCVAIDPTDTQALLALALEKGIDLAIVGPELPLTLGLADVFEQKGILVAGPSQYAAQLEGSKAFAKKLMAKYGVPTAAYREFDDPAAAKEYVRSAGRRLVVKADGLCGGKGVLLCKDPAEAEAACVQVMEALEFGQAGCKVVVEEWLEGEEASFLVFTDGHTIVPMPTSQDHKAIGEGDTGPNTGGMGAYSPAPVVTPEMAERVMKQVIHPMIDGMRLDGTPYKGILYAGLMIDAHGDFKVLEFNARFGDPECQPLLMRLESDLADILHKLAQGKLHEAQVEWSPKPTVCVVLASGGYPGHYDKGKEIKGLESAATCSGVVVFHAGTALKEGRLVTNGGRVLGVTAIGDTIKDAIEKAYEACDQISWQGMYYRRDIGHRALARLKADPRPRVGVVMGSASDWEVMKGAVEALKALGIPCEARVLSAHRTPEQAGEYARTAKERGLKVIIAGAGWAAHLAGAMAAHTTLPILGVPIASSPLNGMDALLATVQMPPGIPVGTLAIGAGGAKNAGLLAAQILALGDTALAARLVEQRQKMAQQVLAGPVPGLA